MMMRTVISFQSQGCDFSADPRISEFWGQKHDSCELHKFTGKIFHGGGGGVSMENSLIVLENGVYYRMMS